MKKIAFVLCLFGCVGQSTMAGSVENYVQSFEKISENYQQNLRKFFKTLDRQQTQFSPEQEKIFCGLTIQYVKDVYQAADKNRDALEKVGKKVSEWQVLVDVMSRKEMEILAERYDVECSLD